MQRTLSLLKSHRLELWVWWLLLLALVVLGAWLRLVALGHDLPANADLDEPNYFYWASDVRATGFPGSHNGSGYPPGFLYLYAAEQPIVEMVRGPLLDRSVDYILFARIVNGLFGAAGIVLAALVTRQISHSNIAGLLTGAFVALNSLLVEESRRAAANAPWVFFTLLAFLCLFQALPSGRSYWLYLALLSGIISFLFKYQSGVFLGLPFLYGLVLWRRDRLWLRHFGVWLVGLSVLFLWLLFVYHITSIVNTPETDTASAISSGQLAGLQSWQSNWNLIVDQLKGSPLVGWALATVAGAGCLLAIKKPHQFLEALDVLALGIFCILFYLLMALFQTTAPSKWLTLLVAVVALGYSGLMALANQVGQVLLPKAKTWGQIVTAVFSAIIIWYFAISRWQGQANYWREVYTTDWLRPYSVNALDAWFAQNAPQGGRVLVKANKILFSYVYADQPLHSDTIPSIFDQPISEYRGNAYDYLIWNDLGNNSSSNPDYFNSHLPDLEAQGAHEVLRINNDTYWGPAIVVFQIPAYQQHPLYGWFTQAISFRGYDLNAETYKAGDEVRLMLYWESAQVIKANYIVFVHLLDPLTGKLVAGQDGPPDYGNTPTWKWQGDMQLIRDQRIFTIPAQVAPGTYALSIGMYDADTQQRVQVTDLQNQPVGDGLPLQPIVIGP